MPECLAFWRSQHGARLENRGHAILNLEPEADRSTALRSCFQVDKVTQPLMSVGSVCDNKMRVIFDDTKAVVETLDGAQLCVFERKLCWWYKCKMRLTSSLGRQEHGASDHQFHKTTVFSF